MLIEAESDLRVVGEAADGVTALQLIEQLHPHVAVVDLSMPSMNGIELVSKMQTLPQAPYILALTANEDPSYVRLLLQLGATGYLMKRSAAEELHVAIRTVARGERFLAMQVINLIVDQLPLPEIVADGPPSATLSDRERSILQMIAEGFTNKEIAASLDISIKTVETYKARGMQKLNLRGRAEIVRYATTVGWLKTS